MGSVSSFVKLRNNSEFAKVYKEGKRWHSDGLVIFFQEGAEKKVGFTASKKVGNAVKRNFAKRRMRALFYENDVNLSSGTYVLVAKASIYKMPFQPLKKGFLWSLKRLGCLKV